MILCAMWRGLQTSEVGGIRRPLHSVYTLSWSGATRIRSHQYATAKLCKRILGYDANALYLSTMLNDMPCGEEKVTDYEDPVLAATTLKNEILTGKLFGFVKCKLVTPQNLWPKFQKMPPIFVNREVAEKAVPREMLNYLNHTGRKRTAGKKAAWRLWVRCNPAVYAIATA